MVGDSRTCESLEFDAIDREEAASLPDLDVLLGALEDETRRQILYYLRSERDAELDALADVVVGWQLDDDALVAAKQRERIFLDLYHVHLPKLADARLVEYDHETETAVLKPLPEPVQKLLTYANRYDATVEDSQYQPLGE